MRAVRLVAVFTPCTRSLFPSAAHQSFLLPRRASLSRHSCAFLRTSAAAEEESKLPKRDKLTPNISDEEKARITKRIEAVKATRAQWPFHMSMSEEKKAELQKKIDLANAEQPPPGLFGKVKFYLKRYWYIAVPAHAASCTLWFVALYAVVSSGVDVISLLESLMLPEWVIEKVKSTPPSAGVFVIALLLYKVATPFRYATSLLFIQAIFSGLKRMGRLKTAREVEYRVRTDCEKVKMATRRYYDQRGLGVRQFTRQKKEEAQSVKNRQRKE